MDVDKFLTRHGEQWLTLRNDPMWRDLLECIRGFDPARNLPRASATDVTNNAQHFLGRIAGFNLAVQVIALLEPGPQHVSIEPTYRADTEEQLP